MVKLCPAVAPRTPRSTWNVMATVAMAEPPRSGPLSIFVTVPTKIVPAARAICEIVIGPGAPGDRLCGSRAGGGSRGGDRKPAESGPADTWRTECGCPGNPSTPRLPLEEAWPRNPTGTQTTNNPTASREPQLLPCMENHLARNICSERTGETSPDANGKE